jgi:hypothetical protein
MKLMNCMVRITGLLPFSGTLHFSNIRKTRGLHKTVVYCVDSLSHKLFQLLTKAK